MAKKSNYKKLYKEIWEERQVSGFCICEECGKGIYEPKVHNFAHVKSKGAYPELKYDKTNIKIKCYKCHAQERCSGTVYDELPI